MSKLRLLKALLRTSLLVTTIATSSLARERAVTEVGGGYQFMLDVPAELIVPQGYYASAAWNTTDWLAVVGEFATSGGAIESDRYDVYTFMGGVRLRRGGFFGQVLLGQIAVRYEEARRDGVFEETITDTAFQPGVGWDVRITNRVAARIQVDYRQLLSDEDRFGRQVRATAGIVVGVGGNLTSPGSTND